MGAVTGLMSKIGSLFGSDSPLEQIAEFSRNIKDEEADRLANLSLGIEKCPYEKTFITISYNNKDEAKKLGAKWDLKKKSWYYDDKITEENKDKLNLLEKEKANESVIDINKNYINISFSIIYHI